MSALFTCREHGTVAIDVAGQELRRASCPICRRAMAVARDEQRVVIVPADTAERIARVAEQQGVRAGQVVDAWTIEIGGLP